MSKVKSILVSDVETFEQELIQELIKNQISYVQIENEFHFLEHIYRIYDLETITKVYLSFPRVNLDKLENCIVVGDERVLPIISKFTEVTEYVPRIDLKDDFNFWKDNHSPRFNKQLIKQQNRQVNKIVNKK